MSNRLQVEQVVEKLQSAGLGFERVEHVAGSTYKDSSTVIVIPTRRPQVDQMKPEDGARYGIDDRVVATWLSLIAPMNQPRAIMFASGHEVGKAYNAMIANILAHPVLSKWKYVMTMEDDNLQPPDAHVKLLESIEWGNYDGVSGLYFTKGEVNMPMAYGDPAEYQRTGVLEFRPRDVRAALAAGQILPVNGIACGCSLYRMDLFREIPPPWFVTFNDVIEGKGPACMTQDLNFCEKAVRAGKRFAVDMRVRVGHLDPASGIVF